jgi:hypothetical protein
MSIKIIAFCGAKESGKSTSGTIFRNWYKGPTEEIAFAGHLKNTCSKVFNLEMKYFLDTKLKEKELNSYIRLTKDVIEDVFREFQISEFNYDTHIRPHIGQVFDTPRKLLQYIGTDLLHPIDKLIHINFALKNLNPNVITVITDLRFPQEFDVLYQRDDFLPVHVYNIKAETAAIADSHASERGWQTFKDKCVQVDNNGSFEALALNLENAIKEKL